MVTRTAKWLMVMSAFLLAASCTTTATRGTAESSPATINVVNFLSSTQIGITTEVNFSVVNTTDRDLTNLTLTVDTAPYYGLDVPFREETIDRIPAHGSWAPNEPFLVRGREPGENTIYFTVESNGTVLGKNYALVDVAPGQYYRMP